MRSFCWGRDWINKKRVRLRVTPRERNDPPRVYHPWKDPVHWLLIHWVSHPLTQGATEVNCPHPPAIVWRGWPQGMSEGCLLYTSDAADE